MLSALIGADPMTLDTRPDISSDIKLWSLEKLKDAILSFSSFSEQDAIKLASIAKLQMNEPSFKIQYDCPNLPYVPFLRH